MPTTAGASQELARPPVPRRDRRIVTVTPASEIRPERVRWLWQAWIPLGALTTLAGQQGLGKSTLAYELAARVTRGELAGGLARHPSGVLVVTLEDHVASVVVPRLLAAGADPERVHIVGVREGGTEGTVTLPTDLAAIEAAARDCGARLLIIDPVVASLPDSINSHNDQHVRRAFAPLAAFAQRCDMAVLVVMHLNKGQAADLLNRVSGSIAFTAAPRSVIAFARHPGDDKEGDLRVTVHAKSNLGRHAKSIEWRMEGRTIEHAGELLETNRLVEVGECSVSGQDLVQGVGERDERSALDEAVEFLGCELADGPKLAEDVRSVARALGISDATLKRAKRKLKVTSALQRFQGPWEWSLQSGSTRGEPLCGGDVDPVCEKPVATRDSSDGASRGVQIAMMIPSGVSGSEDQGVEPRSDLPDPAAHDQVNADNGVIADRIRAQAAVARCCCQSRPEPGGVGRCGRCGGRL